MPDTHHLFTVTRVLLRIATGFCFFLIAVLAVAMGALEGAALGLFHLPIPANEMHGLTLPQILAAATLVITGGVICIALAAWMFILTARIIDTGSHGDPFVTVNADRLNHIACLLLAVQVVGFAVDALMNLFPPNITRNVSVGYDGFSAAGILAALLIFVLAQIFRHGSEMRAELEGTV
ncbi:MAG TPA: DUF2975 domain-containing protein [Rhizomicrobium sp.]|nr:DUF2975 domain-containing protein [Rhizomicrobium sp.]